MQTTISESKHDSPSSDPLASNITPAMQSAIAARVKYRNTDYKEFYRNDELGIEILMSTCGIYAMGWRGKAIKPSFNYRFRSQDRCLDYLNDFINKAKEIEQSKKQRQAEQNAIPRNVEVNDVLVSIWGYEQTNVDYYQVVELVGKSSAYIREIAKEKMDGEHFMTGTCVPLIDQFVGEKFLARVKNGRIRLNSFSGASKKEYIVTNGVRVYPPDHWTAYA